MRGWDKLHPMSKALYEETYFLPNENYEGWLDRVARAYQNNEAHGTRMKEYISNYWFHPSTPPSSNAGTDRGLPISCFTKSVFDDKPSIFSNYNEAFNLGAFGGGIGSDWSKVREINHTVGTQGGTSSGIIPFMGISDRSTLAISQGGLRRASEAVYLDISHPEIEEFIDLRKPTGDQNRRSPNLHHGVVIPDSFMNSVIYDKKWDLVSPKDGTVVKTVKARDLWTKLLEVRQTLKGEPYLLFIDTVNELAPDEYKHEGIKVSTSNLCVTGDTKILTKDFGYVEIEKVAGQNLKCWNGKEWADTELLQTSEGQEVMEVSLSNNVTIKATPYHKWYIGEGDVETRTKDLQPEQVITAFYDEAGTYYDSITILSVEATGEVAPTYCGNEPKEHKLMFNGVLTGNCTEITLRTDDKHSGVCCLASINLEYWDEYLPNIDEFIADCTDYLDNILQDFIDRTEGLPGFERARAGAIDERSIGLGVMGFHSYLQSKMIPWESAIAKGVNLKIFKQIKESADTHNRQVGSDGKYCPMSERNDSIDWARALKRNIHVTAIAPTMSISSLTDVTSSGIEPWVTNAFTKKVKQGSFSIKNKYLDTAIMMHAHLNFSTYNGGNIQAWIDSQWDSIKKNNGSVQHLDWMDQNTKDVFKTAFEIDQRWVIEMAGDRQQFIDQAQSLNLFIPGGSHVQYISDLHILAWKKKVKSLYYLRSSVVSRASTSSNERKHISKEQAVDLMSDTCIGCA